MRRFACYMLAGVGYFAGFAGFAGDSSAQAQGYGAGCGGYWFGPPYNYMQRETIPYFSLHPPVYYSAPIPRTYGYSPFAYPPGVMTPELDLSGPQPEEIRNPYVPQEDGVKPTAAAVRVTVAPAVIYNPYVDRAQVSAR